MGCQRFIATLQPGQRNLLHSKVYKRLVMKAWKQVNVVERWYKENGLHTVLHIET